MNIYDVLLSVVYRKWGKRVETWRDLWCKLRGDDFDDMVLVGCSWWVVVLLGVLVSLRANRRVEIWVGYLDGWRGWLCGVVRLWYWVGYWFVIWGLVMMVVLYIWCGWWMVMGADV